MYQQYSVEQRKTFLQLPSDYRIDYCIVYGSWKTQEYTNKLIQSAQSLGINIKKEKDLSGFIQPIQSFLINTKRVRFIVEYGGVKLSEYLHRACMLGSQTNIFLGSCGGLKPGLQSCDIIIPTFSYGNESSTRMYKRDNDHKHYSDKNLSNQLFQSLHSKDNHTVYQGPIMTCGAMLAETQEDVDNRSQDGYYGVEMESSTVFALSNYFSIPSAAMIYVSDNLIEGQSVIDEGYIKEKSKRNLTIQQLFESVLEILFDKNMIDISFK